jgi:ribosomal protein S18 acetylase RimI-like enzyme
MDDGRLATLEHENLIAALSVVGRNIEGAVVRRDHGIALIATGLPVRLFNQALVEADDPAPATVADAVAVLRDRGGPFVVNLRVGTDDGVIPVTAGLGLVPISAGPWMPGMALHPLPGAASRPSAASQPAAASKPSAGPPAEATEAGHDIRKVTDAAGLEDHIRAGAAGFEMPEALLRRTMSGSLAAGDDVAIYVAYEDGRPVGSGLGFQTGRVIGVYNIATVPWARKRGFGVAMTMQIVTDGAARGCDVAVLQASEMGYPIYERLGFRTVVEYMGYGDRPPSE